MLRYVSRRIKDTVERTSNVLETRCSWTYGNEGVGVYDGCNQPSFDHNKQFERLLDRRVSNKIFEFGLEPKAPINEHVVRKRVSRGSLGKVLRKCAASDTTADSGYSSSDKEDFKERIHSKHQCKFQKNFIDALTWVN